MRLDTSASVDAEDLACDVVVFDKGDNGVGDFCRRAETGGGYEGKLPFLFGFGEVFRPIDQAEGDSIDANGWCQFLCHCFCRADQACLGAAVDYVLAPRSETADIGKIYYFSNGRFGVGEFFVYKFCESGGSEDGGDQIQIEDLAGIIGSYVGEGLS